MASSNPFQQTAAYSSYDDQQQQQQQQQQQYYQDQTVYQAGDYGASNGVMAENGAAYGEASAAAEPAVDVDLSKYPEPLESTKKIRGRSDLIEWFCGTINRELIIAKAFYLFFFSAFGSLLPLMAIYFKNMGMTPTQAGILIGIRPFVGYLSAPFWADIADR